MSKDVGSKRHVSYRLRKPQDKKLLGFHIAGHRALRITGLQMPPFTPKLLYVRAPHTHYTRPWDLYEKRSVERSCCDVTMQV
jgi:hypothetical protein